jgi:hypothetical protein
MRETPFRSRERTLQSREIPAAARVFEPSGAAPDFNLFATRLV